MLCGAATVANVDGVYVSDVSGGDTRVQLDARAGAFARLHGRRAAAPRSSSGSTSAAVNDTVLVRGEQQGATIALGTQGINLNVGSDELEDSDVSLPGVETVMVIGWPANDWASAQGGHGTGVRPMKT